MISTRLREGPILLRKIVRGFFAFNVVYEIAAGVTSMVAPRVISKVFDANPDDPKIRAFIRLVGPQALFNALVCGLIAANPDKHSTLLRIRGLLAVAILIAEGTVWAKGEVERRVVTTDMALQVVLIFLALAYRPATGAAKAR